MASLSYYIANDYFDTRTFNGSVLQALLIDATHTPNTYHTFDEIIADEVVATGYERKFMFNKSTVFGYDENEYTETQQLRYPSYNGTNPRYILIADTTNEIPLWLLDYTEIDSVSADIIAQLGLLATVQQWFGRADWVDKEYTRQVEADSGTVYNADSVTTFVDSVDDFDTLSIAGALVGGKAGSLYTLDLAPQIFETHWKYAVDEFRTDVLADSGTVFDSPEQLFYDNRADLDSIAIFGTLASGKAGALYLSQPRSQVFDQFSDAVTTDSGTVYNFYPTSVALNTDFELRIPMTSGKAGSLYAWVGQIPSVTVETGSFNYAIPTANLTPLLTALRSTDFTTTTLDIQNTGVDAYDIQIQSADNQQAKFGGGYDNTDAVTTLPFVDTVANTRLNYKYRGRFQISGTIAGSPVTVNGAWSAPRYTVGKGQTIV